MAQQVKDLELLLLWIRSLLWQGLIPALIISPCCGCIQKKKKIKESHLSLWKIRIFSENQSICGKEGKKRKQDDGTLLSAE